VKQISQKAPDIKILNGGSSQSGLFVADEKEFLRFDLKDPKAADFSQAIGLSIQLSNAVKFTKDIKGGEDGVIVIDAKKMKKDQEEEYVVVSVKDSGTGIDPEILTRLFERFASKSFSGTGLGLFISKSIIEAHGGKMWDQNNPDGKGATFAFSLPIVNNK
jgi:signal transduction histidine kinase